MTVETREDLPGDVGSSRAASDAWADFIEAVNWDLPGNDDWRRFLRFAAVTRREGITLSDCELRDLVHGAAGDRADWVMGLLTEAYRLTLGPE